MLSVCTLVFAVAIILQGSVQTYWQLVLLRMLMAAGEAGCNPLATGIMSDVFPEKKRALVMAIFNWGIYGGYGIAFPVGRYITQLNIWDLVSSKTTGKVCRLHRLSRRSLLINNNHFFFQIKIALAYLLLWRWCIGYICCCFNRNHIERTRTKIDWRRFQSRQSQKSITFQSANAATHYSVGDRCINSSFRWNDFCL